MVMTIFSSLAFIGCLLHYLLANLLQVHDLIKSCLPCSCIGCACFLESLSCSSSFPFYSCNFHSCCCNFLSCCFNSLSRCSLTSYPCSSEPLSSSPSCRFYWPVFHFSSLDFWCDPIIIPSLSSAIMTAVPRVFIRRSKLLLKDNFFPNETLLKRLPLVKIPLSKHLQSKPWCIISRKVLLLAC